MAVSMVGGRRKSTRHASRSLRSIAASKHDKSKKTHDDGEVKKAVVPDAEEIRRRRTAYFSHPVAERQKVIRPKPSVTAPKTSRSTKDGYYRSKSKTNSRRPTSNNASRTNSESERRTADFVYTAPVTTEEVILEPVRPRLTKERVNELVEISQASRQCRHASSSKSSLPSVLQAEVTPDDSISVVAEKRMSRSRSSLSRAGPCLRRSTTTSAKLQSAPEAAGCVEPPVTSRRTPRREPSLLEGIFKKQATTPAPRPLRLVECLTCGSDDVPRPQSAKLSCGHRMCHDCLKRIFEMSVKDPAHMPPKCCTEDHIPLKHVEKLFDLKFKMIWNRKYQEYNTKNRIYCVQPKCGEWIKPSHIQRNSSGRKYAQCPRCKTKVCIICNNKMHKSSDCPRDPEIAKLVEQAKEQGWQRCYDCNAMVELKEGCNHMTCRCLAEFCIICGSKWKTCDCPWFNYSSLPNPDRLNEMRVPEPIRLIYRRVLDAARPENPPPPAPPAMQQRQPVRAGDRTYQDEMERRRRQERLDADLARRMQLASLMEADDDTVPPRRRAEMETWGVGNAAVHFMNDDFVQNAANVVMSAFGNANMGRRGERASGRRRRPTQTEHIVADGGLAANFLGDESVLGVGPAERPARARVRSSGNS